MRNSVLVFAIGYLLTLGIAEGEELTVLNSGFEAHALAPGDATENGVGLDPWTFDVGTDVGVWDISNGASFPDGAPEGENVAFSYGPGISQQLASTLQAGSLYTLEVSVGASPVFAFPGYELQLVAGATVLVSDAFSVTVHSGEHRTVQLLYQSPTGDPHAGEALEIRLLAQGAEVTFDDVKLFRTTGYVEDPPPYLYEWGQGGTGDGQHQFLWGGGVSMDGHVYTVDASLHRVSKFDHLGEFELMFGWGVATGGNNYEVCSSGCQAGIAGSGAGQLNGARGAAVNSVGEVFVSDEGNHRIQVFSSSGAFLEAWGWGVATGSNQYEICTVNCLSGIPGGGDGQFAAPHSVAVDPTDDSVLVADANNSRIQRLRMDGTYVEMYGWGVGGVNLSNPTGVAADATGNLFVASIGTDQIVKIDAAGNLVKTWGGTGGQPGQFSGPHGVAVDSSGNVFVAEVNNTRIQKFDNNGRLLTMWGRNGSDPGEFGSPTELSALHENIWVFDTTGRIQVFGDTVLFDGFESGDASYWTATVP